MRLSSGVNHSDRILQVKKFGPLLPSHPCSPCLILHYDGQAWHNMSKLTTCSLNIVWGKSSSDVFAAGRGGTILQYDGKIWNSLPVFTGEEYYGIWGNYLSRDIFITGSEGSIIRYSY